MYQLRVLEMKNQRVLTTAQLAETYGTDTKTVSYNFNYNKNRFTEGKHYFVLSGEERREFIMNNREIHDSSKHAKVIYLWTAKGALLHAKSLGTDEAWEKYEQLVDDYFQKVENLQQYNIPTKIPSSIEDILELAVINMRDLRNEIKEVREENKHLKVIVDNSIYLDDHQKALVQEAVKARVSTLMKKGFDSHFQSIYSDLKVFFTVPKYDKILRKDFDKAIEFITGWHPKKNETA